MTGARSTSRCAFRSEAETAPDGPNPDPFPAFGAPRPVYTLGEPDTRPGRPERQMTQHGITVALAALLAAGAAWHPAAAQRTPDGNPDLNGIWQAIGSAHWDLEAHAARHGPVEAMGALGAIPAGLSVVEGGTIPYQPWAAEKRRENLENWLKLDPAVKCYMPGIPRATYMPFPFQIVQTPKSILFAYEFASTSRVVRMDRPGSEALAPSWMGYGLGRWEGEDAGRRRDGAGS